MPDGLMLLIRLGQLLYLILDLFECRHSKGWHKNQGLPSLPLGSTEAVVKSDAVLMLKGTLLTIPTIMDEKR